MSRVRARLGYAKVVATVALFVALGGGAWAAGSRLIGSHRLIHGCVLGDGGLLRIVAAGGKCSRDQHVISVNKKGPQRARALPGPQGPRGAQGDPGQVGPPGAAGATDAGFSTPSSSPHPFATPVLAAVTTTTPTKLLVTGWVKAGLGCSAAASCSDFWGLYVDGVPVSGSAHGLAVAAGGNTSAFVLTTGTTPVLPVGTHKIQLKDDTSANVASVFKRSARVSAVAVGG